MKLQPPAPAVPEHDTITCDIDVLNSLLRGEVAAVETYDLVIPKFAGQPPAAELQRIRGEHADAAEILRDRIRHFGGDPAETSGAWGKLTAVITGTAKVFGAAAALGTLKQGEEYGIGQYQNALADPEVDAAGKALIRDRLLPQCRRHVAHLWRLIAAVRK